MKSCLALILTIGMLATTACATGAERAETAGIATAVAAGAPTEAVVTAAPDTALGDAINDFGFELARVIATDADGNVVVSPLSLHVALAMTANGAGGATLDEMTSVLGVDPDLARSDAAYANLIAAVTERTGETTVTIANSLWAAPEVAWEDAFLDADRKYFGAEVSTLDFADDTATDAVNGWVSEHTDGRIEKVVDSFPPATVLSLVNAVHFLGDWEKQFEAEATRDDTFTPDAGEPFRVPFMGQSDSFAYAENAELQMARMGYKGGRFAAYVVVPREGATASNLLESMDAATWRALVDSTVSREGYILLPKVETEFKAGLADQLKAMGLVKSTSDEADFSGMTTDFPLWIGAVDHATYLRIDEQGTEAAGASAVSMVAGMAAGDVEPPFELRADRPFLFAIADEPSGALLFLGLVNDPR